MPARKDFGRSGSGAWWTAILAAFTVALLILVAREPWMDINPPWRAATALEPGYVYSGGPVVTLELRNYTSLPRALVLVNHEPRANFGQRYVTVPVWAGDLIEVDGTFYTHPIVVRVLDVSRGVTAPPAGRTVEVDGNVATVAQVRLTRP